MDEFDPTLYLKRPSEELFGSEAIKILDDPYFINTALGDTTVLGLAQHVRIAQYEAQHDPLTDLLTRDALIETANQRFAEADKTNQHFGVIYFDLVNFKAVNDKLGGHNRGDEVLREVAQRLKNSLRSEHDLIAHGTRYDDNKEPGRLGGDEFAVVVELGSGPLTEDEIMGRLELIRGRILKEQLNPYVENNTELQDVNFGFATGMATRLPGETAESVIKRADDAMYSARHEELRPLNRRERIAYWLQKRISLSRWGLPPRELEHRIDAERRESVKK